MNKSVAIFLLAGALTGGPAQGWAAAADERGLEQWQAGAGAATGDIRYRQEWQGAGIGGLAGALLAGPPGFVVGAVGGALAGRNAGLEPDLLAARREVEQLRQQRQADARGLSELTLQLQSARAQRRQLLQAVADGLIYRLHFRTGQSVMEPVDQRAVKRLATALRRISGLRVEVHAHADRRGDAAGNRQLSEARARTVAEQLLREGVTADRILSSAHGELQARYPADDREGLGYDRQVVIRFRVGEAP